LQNCSCLARRHLWSGHLRLRLGLAAKFNGHSGTGHVLQVHCGLADSAMWRVPWVLEICWRQVTCPVGLFSATLHVDNHLLRLLHVESSKSQFGHSRSTIAGPYSQLPQHRARSDLPFPYRYAGCLHGHLRVGSQATWAGPTTRCHHS